MPVLPNPGQTREWLYIVRSRDNEIRFRRYADTIAHFMDELGDPGDMEFECECGDPHCSARVRIHVDHYRMLRRHPVAMIGHRPEEDQRILWNHGAFHVVSRAAERRRGIIRLGRMLQRLTTERVVGPAFVIVTDPDRHYYVQFAPQGESLFFEAVHNKYLEPARALSEEQISLLFGLGFLPPGHSTQNWFQELRPGSRKECMALGRLAVKTLETVYGMRRGRMPVLEPWWEAQDRDEASETKKEEDSDA